MNFSTTQFRTSQQLCRYCASIRRLRANNQPRGYRFREVVALFSVQISANISAPPCTSLPLPTIALVYCTLFFNVSLLRFSLSLSLCVCLYEVTLCILLFCMPGVSGMPVLLNSRTTFKCCCTILAYSVRVLHNKQTNMILLPSIHCTFQDSVFS